MATEFEESFFQESYDAEIERMHKLDLAVAFPTGVITILGGWIVYYAQNLPAASWHVLFVLFLVCVLAAAAFWAGGVYYTILHWSRLRASCKPALGRRVSHGFEKSLCRLGSTPRRPRWNR
jgi:hypothetical protein